jgi:hypothetical protein
LAAGLPLQFPLFVVTVMLLYVPAAGLPQFGAFIQVRLVVTGVFVEPSLHVTDGGVIAVPAVPVEGTAPQESVHVAGATILILPHDIPGL